MSAILEQLGLDQTFFVQLAIFAIVFFFLKIVYFKPFMGLFEIRRQRIIADREAANKLMAQAEAKFSEYQRKLAEEKAAARKEYETMLSDAKKEEAEMLARSREEAKKMTQAAVEDISKQKDHLKQQLEGDVTTLVQTIAEKILTRAV